MVGLDELYNTYTPMGSHANQSGKWKTFSSYEEMVKYIKNNTPEDGTYEYLLEDRVTGLGGVTPLTKSANSAPTATALQGSAAGSSVDHDYSKTNIQVAGVDEADIVKTDGEYIYVLSKGASTSQKPAPPRTQRSSRGLNLQTSRPARLFISGDRLTVLAPNTIPNGYDEPVPSWTRSPARH